MESWSLVQSRVYTLPSRRTLILRDGLLNGCTPLGVCPVAPATIAVTGACLGADAAVLLLAGNISAAVWSLLGLLALKTISAGRGTVEVDTPAHVVLGCVAGGACCARCDSARPRDVGGVVLGGRVKRCCRRQARPRSWPRVHDEALSGGGLPVLNVSAAAHAADMIAIGVSSIVARTARLLTTASCPSATRTRTVRTARTRRATRISPARRRSRRGRARAGWKWITAPEQRPLVCHYGADAGRLHNGPPMRSATGSPRTSEPIRRRCW